MSTQLVKVPDIGGAEGVEVIEILVAVGDHINKEDSLVVLESDKASMEIPSPYSGKVIAIKAAVGDSLSEGDTFLELDVEVDEVTTNNQEKSIAPKAEAVDSATVVANNIHEQQANAIGNTVAGTPASDSTESSIETIFVPDLGGGEAEVIEVCIKVGDEIAEGDSLAVLETDKASMELPSPKAGTVVSVAMKEGDKANEGAVVLELRTLSSVAIAELPQKVEKAPEKQAAVSNTVAAASSVTKQAPNPAMASASGVPASAKFYAGPAVRKLARELGVELNVISGTGPKGRIAKDDLKNHVKTLMQNPGTVSQGAAIPAIPVVDFSVFGSITLEPLTKIQKLTAANMQRSWLNVPHVTQFDDADITSLEDFRASLKAQAQTYGVKITPLPFLLKACAHALKKHPKLNASLHSDAQHLVLKHYVNIGIAVDTPVGLLVPVIRDVDKKSIWELAAETAELAAKAKERKLKPTDMQGGCFTVSSLGGIGGQGFTPIVNAPELAILGVSKMAVKPHWNGNEFVPRKMLPLSLSYDHRAINGVDGGKFLTELTQLLADIRLLVL